MRSGRNSSHAKHFIIEIFPIKVKARNQYVKMGNQIAETSTKIPGAVVFSCFFISEPKFLKYFTAGAVFGQAAKEGERGMKRRTIFVGFEAKKRQKNI